MNEETKMILDEIKGMREDIESMHQEIESMHQEIGGMHQEIGGIHQEIGSIREDIGGMHQEIGSMREDIGGIHQEIGSIREDMKAMETSLRQEIRDGDNAIRMILENEIRPQIRIVAENHINLEHKLKEVLENVKTNELLELRVGYLEKEVLQIKEKILLPE